MDIFRYFAEDHEKRLIFLFTFEIDKENFIKKVESEVGYKIYIYDIFPEPYQETVILDDIISVITKNGSEMFIPAGLEVNFFSMVRVLFGEELDEAAEEIQ